MSDNTSVVLAIATICACVALCYWAGAWVESTTERTKRALHDRQRVAEQRALERERHERGHPGETTTGSPAGGSDDEEVV